MTELGKPRDADVDRATVAELRSRIDEAHPVSDKEASLSGDDPEYMVITRHVPAEKGKWRMVSKEVEEGDSRD